MINVFIFRYETEDYYYYFAKRPTQKNSPDCPYNKILSCLCLKKLKYISYVSLNFLLIRWWQLQMVTYLKLPISLPQLQSLNLVLDPFLTVLIHIPNGSGYVSQIPLAATTSRSRAKPITFDLVSQNIFFLSVLFYLSKIKFFIQVNT